MTEYLTVRCTQAQCKAATRIAVIPPIVARMPNMYCPVCGAQALQFIDPDQDMWETLAEAHKLSISNTQKLHNLWSMLPEAPQTFSQFITEVRAAHARSKTTPDTTNRLLGITINRPVLN